MFRVVEALSEEVNSVVIVLNPTAIMKIIIFLFSHRIMECMD